MIEILLNPKVMTFVCFGWWAIAMVVSILISIFKPVGIMQKIDWHEPRDLLLISSGMAWIAMWCFRTMY